MALLDRLLGLLGLDLDVGLDLRGESFHAITPTLTLGSRPRPDQVDALRDLGITHVVSALDASERPSLAFLDAGFETLFLSLRDGVGEDVSATFPAFFDFVAGARRALVHCEAGVSRSATLATAHVMRSARLRFYEAYLHVRARRAQVLPNVGFASQLQRLERDLFPEPRDGHASLTRYLHEVCRVPVEIDVLQEMLDRHDHDAVRAIRAIFGDDVPRVIQGVRV
jgi:protein-tyrosine phosphatase